MSDRFWFEDEQGQPFSLTYEELAELDESIYPQILKPTGKFCYSANTFLRLPIAESPFYVQNWLPKQGKAMIYGQAKAGKSFLATQMSRCIGSGESFLGLGTTTASVLYLQFELGFASFQKRLVDTKQSYDNVYVGTSFSIKLDTEEGQDELTNELYLVRPNVLVLDPLYKMLSGDENEAKDVIVICDFLDKLIDEFGLSILFLHHSGKDLDRGGRGSSVLEGWVDSSIEMKKTSSDNKEELHARLTPKLLRHSALPLSPIEVTLGKDFEFHLGEKETSIKELVLGYIQSKGRVKMQEIIDAGIGSRRSVYEAKKNLIDEGKIEDLKDGTYKVKEA